MRGLTRNSFIFFVSESTSAFLTMLTGLLIARFLPVAAFGRFTAALAFAAIVAVIVDSGMGMLAAKDIAQSSSAGMTRANQLFSWRLWIIFATCLCLTLCGRAFFTKENARLVMVLTPSVLLIGLTDFFCWLFKGAQRAAWCAALQIAARFLLLIFCAVALSSRHPLTALLWAYAIAGIGTVSAGLVVISRALRNLRWVRLPRAFFQETLPGIYKLGAILMLSVAFTRVDVMLVAWLRGAADTGLFSAAGRIVDALRLIPMVVYSVYLPLFSMLHDEAAALRRQFLSAYTVLLMLATLIAVVGSLAAKPLFHIVLGAQYDGAVACFQPLLWSCVLMFSNILMFSLLYAKNDHRTPFLAITAALATEVLLDLFCLPRFGIVAAGWARLLAEAVNGLMLAGGLIRLRVLSAQEFFMRPLVIVGAGLALAQLLRRPWMIAGALTLYYAVTVAWYWLPLLAARRPSTAVSDVTADAWPQLVIVAPARNAAGSLTGMVRFIESQEYPKDRRRLILLIDSDDEADPSPAVARGAGAEVYQRVRPSVRTKGGAINDLLTHLKDEPWDALLIFDIDVRGDAQILRRAAAHWRRGAHAVQAAVLSKNPLETAVAGINHSAQLLSQLIQRGRAALGWSAIFSGNGMMLSRACLERLQWQTSTENRLSDDGELNLRLLLLGIPIVYGGDMILLNDLAADNPSMRQQRRRWFIAYTEARAYVGPLLRKGLSGHWRALEGLYTHVFLAGCSLSFVLGALWLAILTGLSLREARYVPWVVSAGIFWVLHAVYYLVALRTVGGLLRWSELKKLPQFLWLRAVAIVEGAILGARAKPDQFAVPFEHRE